MKDRPFSSHMKFRGHHAVTRSLVEGLDKIGASYNYNPSRFGEVADTVHVVGGIRALRQMIRLKRQGRIKKLFAGPNIVVFSTEANSILASPEIDGVVNHCDFACEFWAYDHPRLRDRCFRWPAGVDIHYWQPDPTVNRDHILIFDKRREEDDADRVKPYVEYLRGQGLQVEVLVRCGKQGYTQNQYRALLQRSSLMLGFTVGSESQGIAWAESWSTDVPTLILKNTSNVYQGRRFDCSTAPYLCSQSGLFFDDLEDFKNQFNYWATHREQFTPRAWILENMSDEVCADRLYRYLTAVDT
ncbi:MAG: hypothetical protein HQL78_08375 [Magnetococcales bacterium]|nr:hypothetical protein [Magnetococcales bacterium]